MNQQASPHNSPKGRDDNLYRTCNQEDIWFLLTFRFPIAKIEREGRLVTFCFNKDEIREHMKLWQTGQPVPVSDIRDVFQAKRIFDQVIHGEL